MARLGIGINENVYFGQPKLNEHKTLQILFKQLTGDEEAAKALKAKLEDDPFADWNEGSGYAQSDGDGLTLTIFPFDSKPPQNKPDQVIDAAEMKIRLDRIRGPLFQILEQFYPTIDQNPMRPSNFFKGTGIEKDSKLFATKIMDEAIQEKVYANMVQLFIDGIAPHVDKTDKLFRLLLVRQSKNKAFPSLRTSFLRDNPFIEPMLIPAAASKLKFTSWEKSNGFDKDEPVSQSTADNAKGKAKDSEPVEDPFANQ